MLEKDIENLLASYPDEFFPNAGFKLMDQQVRLGKYYADIIFTDKHSRKIIVEVKRGTLSRDAVGQIIDYYGLVKEQEPKQCIELILCANIIPPERRKFLEIIGIECKELDISLLEKIAKKYNYKFLNELKVETNKEINHKIEIGIDRVILDAENVIIPMADGDEGTVQGLVDATDGEIITATPKPTPVICNFNAVKDDFIRFMRVNTMNLTENVTELRVSFKLGGANVVTLLGGGIGMPACGGDLNCCSFTHGEYFNNHGTMVVFVKFHTHAEYEVLKSELKGYFSKHLPPPNFVEPSAKKSLVDATDGEIITAEVSESTRNRIKSELGKATVSQTTQNPQPVTVITPSSTTIPLKQKHPQANPWYLGCIILFAYPTLIIFTLVFTSNYIERTGNVRLPIFFIIIEMISIVIITILLIWRNVKYKKFKSMK